MALKDWRRIGKDEWKNNNLKKGDWNILRINFDNEEDYSEWVVEWGRYEKGNILNVYDTLGFDKKTQAIKYARAYMRSH